VPIELPRSYAPRWTGSKTSKRVIIWPLHQMASRTE
jgi:hypothetical protein